MGVSTAGNPTPNIQNLSSVVGIDLSQYTLVETGYRTALGDYYLVSNANELIWDTNRGFTPAAGAAWQYWTK